MRESDSRAGVAVVLCECGHMAKRHEVAGFDGECVADGCACSAYRGRRVEATRFVPVAAPLPPLPVTPSRTTSTATASVPVVTAEQLLAAARRSPNPLTVEFAGRIVSALGDLKRQLVVERATAQASQRLAVGSVERPVAAPPAQAPSGRRPMIVERGAFPCPEPGCPKVLTTRQGVGGHRAKAHPKAAAGGAS